MTNPTRNLTDIYESFNRYMRNWEQSLSIHLMFLHLTQKRQVHDFLNVQEVFSQSIDCYTTLLTRDSRGIIVVTGCGMDKGWPPTHSTRHTPTRPSFVPLAPSSFAVPVRDLAAVNRYTIHSLTSLVWDPCRWCRGSEYDPRLMRVRRDRTSRPPPWT